MVYVYVTDAIGRRLQVGEVREHFFDDHTFPINIDKDEYQWIICYDTDHLIKIKVLYHPNVFEMKKAAIVSCIHALDTKRR